MDDSLIHEFADASDKALAKRLARVFNDLDDPATREASRAITKALSAALQEEVDETSED